MSDPRPRRAISAQEAAGGVSRDDSAPDVPDPAAGRGSARRRAARVSDAPDERSRRNAARVDPEDSPSTPRHVLADDPPASGRRAHRALREDADSDVVIVEPPRPVMPDHEWRDDSQPYVPRRSALSAIEPSQVVPRRSALSPTLEPAQARRPVAEQALGGSGTGLVESARQAVVSWLGHPGRAWILGIAALAVVVFLAAFLISKNATVSQEPVSADASTLQHEFGDTLTAEPADLKLGDDLTWRMASTTTTLTADSPAPACIVQDSSMPTPTIIDQRTFSASTNSAALLHRAEVFTSVDEATRAFTSLKNSLASCDSVPTQIISGWEIAGLADQAAATTVVFDDQPVSYHTVLLARTGKQVTIIDAAQDQTAFDAQAVTTTAAGLLERTCSAAGGQCPAATPTATQAVPIADSNPGWLEVSDLPRITAGTGVWTVTTPSTIGTEGTACENMTLATVQGPTSRANRTYLITQDPAATSNFGIDSMRFDFATSADATAFAATLNSSLGNCTEQMPTATVSEATSTTGKDAAGGQITATMRSITQSSTPQLNYQTSVVLQGTHVVYLVAVVDPSYSFTADQWSAISVRAGQRASQAT